MMSTPRQMLKKATKWAFKGQLPVQPVLPLAATIPRYKTPTIRSSIPAFRNLSVSSKTQIKLSNIVQDAHAISSSKELEEVVKEVVKAAKKPLSRLTTNYRRIFWEGPTDIRERKVDVLELIDDFRMLQHIVNRSSSRAYRHAQVQLSSLPKTGEVNGEKVKVSDLLRVIRPGDNIAWRVIASRILDKRPDDLLRGVSKKDKALSEIMRIPNIGPSKADDIYDAGYHTVSDIRSNIDNAPLDNYSTIALSHLEDMEQLIPHSESLAWEAFINPIVHNFGDGKCKCELVGHFRRGAASSMDLDFIVTHPKITDLKNLGHKERARRIIEPIVETLEKQKLVVDEPLARGPQFYRGLVRWNEALEKGAKQVEGAKVIKPFVARQITITVVNWTAWPYALLARTGDANLMEYIRGRAKQMGLAISEQGMGPPSENGSTASDFTVKADTEEDIFKILDLKYLKPSERDYSEWSEKYDIEEI